MKLRNVVIVAGLGIVVGYLMKDQIDKQQSITPEKALKAAKNALKQQGSINGSWIYMQPEEFIKNGLTYTVYRGGVTRENEEDNTQLEFYVDAETGAILEVAETAS
ncbi:PepSY domain-containing protein [Terrihalobacillus insolitus]|uniref:PepSY domain-containing protein n=1 Tax=Terrihalobacillus insolitus TaxID=2950438 RepID=UPI0023428817|nr:PepSY domain-containing protein [Terrihalobacillus insolitus]MDC3415083.1 PepSY domain-containing protein [Terrihalobacillus insolitus]